MFSSSPSPRMGLSWIWQDSVCVTDSPLFRSGVVHASISDHCVCRSLYLCLTICAPDIQLPQPQPNIVEINSDDNSDTGSIVSIPSTADPQARNDLYNSKEEVDPFAEDPLADRPDSSTDESVY